MILLGNRALARVTAPDWDPEGTAAWLQAREAEGWVPGDSGFVGSYTLLRRTKAGESPLRVEPDSRERGLFSEAEDMPPAETVDENREAGWDFVGHRGPFYYYRAWREDAEEPPPDVMLWYRAASLLNRRCLLCLLLAVAGVIAFAMPLARGGFLLGMLSMGSARALFHFAVTGLFAVAMALRARRYRRMARLAGAGEFRPPKAGDLRRCLRLLLACAMAVWAVFTVSGLAGDLSAEDAAIAPRSGLPFASLSEMTGVADARETPFWRDTDLYTEGQDLLAPRLVSCSRIAAVRRPKRRLILGGMEVRYAELTAESLAKILVREYRAQDRRKDSVPIETEARADEIYVRANSDGTVTVLLRKGRSVLHASVYWKWEGKAPVTDWITILADSVDPT